MNKAEQEFIKALVDGSIQRALEDVQKSWTELILAWAKAIESAMKLIARARE